ncbi:NADH:ubiquinone oxidoreductase subunit 4 (chain M) [Microbacterium aurantiacum]|uniref:NADH:ubiquinone oxidoreductase subunit 4 (Chain M) n=1 Tax=Microbacterium aurantiacum TaxID=162393 RepID=A0ABT8FQS4_9MICO|nr:NADH:ubiquinone oxidoreductase subunit 4 (chain M) [Microbacterium aurantiacum]MDN4463666.1 NADH:ubiquinone oxidoreductase subunit 4 (chain M) [Microbacterium aurantiacum]
MRAQAVLISAVAAVLAAVVAVTVVVLLRPAGDAAPLEADEDFGDVRVYAIDLDGAPVPEPGPDAQRVWDLFVRVATPAFAAEAMSEYRVGDAPDSDTMAYVHRDEDDPTLWTLAANIAYADDEDLLTSTLIHEYGHILSLGLADVDPDADDCATLWIDEGCVAASSALFAFDETFWIAYGDLAPAPDDTDAERGEALFEAYPDDFVSDYAATNVVEDFAETFQAFVLEDEPAPDSPVAEKILFFWNLPAYVEVRERIRTDLGWP